MSRYKQLDINQTLVQSQKDLMERYKQRSEAVSSFLRKEKKSSNPQANTKDLVQQIMILDNVVYTSENALMKQDIEAFKERPDSQLRPHNIPSQWKKALKPKKAVQPQSAFAEQNHKEVDQVYYCGY